MTDAPESNFESLGLPEVLTANLKKLGYEAPSPIQAETIPALLSGQDLVGQAQTGTGKTAAFALPILARLQAQSPKPSALVLAPTRELAIQVAEAFHRYADGLPGFHVLPIYGGQAFGPQLAGLRRGADVVVGTPGRVIDHIEKGTLDLSDLSTLVLDEADEMLRMGFIDDVETVLARLPEKAQIVLFSATMPDQIRRIAQRYLKSPAQVTIRSSTTTASSIRQRYWLVDGLHKLDALTRILEVEEFDGMIVFARTRVATEELASRLDARGFAAEALNGDVPQPVREKMVEKLRSGEIDILVATDVAARGLDVERISHVVNYDIPYDTEAYVHRIGRTGRAGRAGEAILFVARRERGMLRAIERATRQPIEPMGLPSVADVNERRMARFKAAIRVVIENNDLDVYREVARACQTETGADMVDIAAALARLSRGDDELFLSEQVDESRPFSQSPRSKRTDQKRPRSAPGRHDDADKSAYRIEVGRVHGVKPGNIVGAIANEGGLDAAAIGRVVIRDEFSLVDLPRSVDEDVLRHLQGVRVAGQALRIRLDQGPGEHFQRRERPRDQDKPGGRPARRPQKSDGPRERKAFKGKSGANADKPSRSSPASAKKSREDGGRPVVTRAQRKAGHGSRGKFRK